MPRVIGLFESQFAVDRCVAELQMHGFSAREVGIILFSTGAKQQRAKGLAGWIMAGGIFGDTVDQSDGYSVMDGITVTASIGALWGVVWGSRWYWGPVAWGFIGLLSGGVAGLIIDRLVPARRRSRYRTAKLNGLIQVEVTVMTKERLDLAERSLHNCNADQVAVIPGENR